jgi:predicted GTPase
MDPLRQQINVAIIGAVSAGKSTLTNALFVEMFSDMHIRRTTALPQVYNTVSDMSKIDNLAGICENNRLKNEAIMASSAKGEELKIDSLSEVNYVVPPVYDLLEDVLKEDVFLTVYDLPGLNDAKTKAVYHQWVDGAFYKFDIVMFVIDVMSALNTSDEMDILELILRNIKENAKKGIYTRLIIIINKCDDMGIVNGKAVPVDEEIRTMVTQVKTIAEAQREKMGLEDDGEYCVNVDYVCASCEDAMIYRMFSRNRDVNLDEKYLNKFGANEYGKSKWNRHTLEEKKELLKKIFDGFDYASAIKQTGFTALDKVLSIALEPQNQYDYLINHIKHNLSVIPMPLAEAPDIRKELRMFHRIRADFGCVNYKFGKPEDDDDDVECVFDVPFGAFMGAYVKIWKEAFCKKAERPLFPGKGLVEEDEILKAIEASMTSMSELGLEFKDGTDRNMPSIQREHTAVAMVATGSISTMEEYKTCFTRMMRGALDEVSKLMKKVLGNMSVVKIDVSPVEFIKEMVPHCGANPDDVIYFLYKNCYADLKRLAQSTGKLDPISAEKSMIRRAVYDMCETHEWIRNTKKWRNMYRKIRDFSNVLYHQWYIVQLVDDHKTPSPEHVPELLRELFASITAAATKDHESGVDIFCDDIPYFARSSRSIPRQVPAEEKDAE